MRVNANNKKTPPQKHVGYCLFPGGYQVIVLGQSGEVESEYTAGDHPDDSQVFGTWRKRVPPARLLKWACQTAREMADELIVPATVGRMFNYQMEV